MEENRIIKRVIKKPVTRTEESENNNNSGSFFKILNVVMFVMVLIIFLRGFNIKKTVREESNIIRTEVKEMIIKSQDDLNNKTTNDKNELLGNFALFLSMKQADLKDQMTKYDNMVSKYNQGLNNLTKEIKDKKKETK